jgi:hypothetical protein
MVCEKWNFVAARSHVETVIIKHYIYITNIIIIIIVILASYIVNQQKQ